MEVDMDIAHPGFSSVLNLSISGLYMGGGV